MLIQNRSRKRALLLDDDVSCIAMVRGRGVVCQRVGMRAPDFGDAPLFVYQKGLISPPSQRNAQIAIKELISPFKITTPSGTAHVPWYHFSWLPTREHRLLPANPDSLIECFNVFKNLTAQMSLSCGRMPTTGHSPLNGMWRFSKTKQAGLTP